VTIRKRIAAADQILLSWAAAAGRPGLDRAMQGLGHAADNGALWIAVATGLGVRRNKWTRRAALRGLASLAIASTTANVIVKQLVGRARPAGPPGVTSGPSSRPLRTTSLSGLVLIVNCSAGTASSALAESLGASLPEAEIIVATADDDMDGLFRKAAARARILGVAGGDGTIRLAAGIAVDAGLPLLVVPAGTFNHFAADLGVESAQDALAALSRGDSVLVDVGTADSAAFLNTASTGVYVDLVQARRRIEPALGKWPAVLIALVHVLRTRPDSNQP